MNLKELVKELAVNQKRASVDLETVDWRVKSSMTNTVREAQEKLVGLKKDYFRLVRSNTFGIFLFGAPDRVAAFVKIAAEEAGVVHVNGGELYEGLARKIEPTLGPSREFGPTQLQYLVDSLQSVKHELDIVRLPVPGMTTVTSIKDIPAMVRYVRQLLQAVVQDDLVRLWVDKKINDQAVAIEFAGNILPVAVTGLEREEVPSLVPIFTNSVSVEVGTAEDGEVDKQYVLNQLTSLKKKLKGKTN